MKILYISSGIYPKQTAGVEIYTYDIAKEMAKNHDVTVIYPVIEKNKPFLEVQKVQNDCSFSEYSINLKNCHKQYIFRRLFYQNYIRDSRVDDSFGRFIEQLKPDVVHIMHLINWSYTIACECFQKKIPTFITLHDYWYINQSPQMLDANNQCYNPKQTAMSKLLKIHFFSFIPKKIKKSVFLGPYLYYLYLPLGLLFYIFSTLNKTIDKRHTALLNILNSCNLCISPSEFLKKMYIQHGIRSDHILVSNNGMDTKKFSSFERKKSKTLRFGFCGGFSELKGIHIVLEAFKQFLNNDQVQLCLFGNYDWNQKNQYSKRIDFMKNIIVYGPYENISDTFSKFDILIAASIWQESQGLIIQEALITKTPMIASNIGAFPEFVRDGYNGFLFSPGDSIELSRKMSLFIEQPDLVKKMSNNFNGMPSNTIQKQKKELISIYEKSIHYHS